MPTNPRTDRELNERTWQGVSVSHGFAVGHVLRIHNEARSSIYRQTLAHDEVEREIERLRKATASAREQLLAIKRRAEEQLGTEHAYIFDAQLLMLEDRKLHEEIEQTIKQQLVNAEWAIKVVADRLLAVYAEIKDRYLRERGSDIEDVIGRLIVTLGGESSPHANRVTENAVIVAEELLPSTIAELDLSKVRALAIDVGGWTSHTAIIARGLGIPAVVGLRDLYAHARTGDPVIADAVNGEITLHPRAETLKRAQAFFLEAEDTKRRADNAPPQPGGQIVEQHTGTRPPEKLTTLDGAEIVLQANVELSVEHENVKYYAARGIGLYRSEFLLTSRGEMPDEDAQFTAYREIVELAGADGATVRLFDAGGDKVRIASRKASADERNPALGLRAVRFCLEHEKFLRTQTRALLRAAAHGNLNVLVPMISDIVEMRQVRQVFNEELGNLLGDGVDCRMPALGAMIEVPSAVLMADDLADEVDFFSLGTNDLVQYLLAVDRGNDTVAGWFRTLHPAVLRAVKLTIDAAQRARIPATVCGEMAGTPSYAFVLVGLGARRLSMNAVSLPRVRRMIAHIDVASATALADECLRCRTADEVESLVRERLGKLFPELFTAKTLPAVKSKE